MSDRVKCYLKLWGNLTQSEGQTFIDLLNDSHHLDDDDIIAQLDDGNGLDSFILEEVNERQLGTDLVKFLKDKNIGIDFCWEQGMYFGEGVYIYDPETKSEFNYSTLDDKIAITIDQADDKELVEKARRASALRDAKFEKPFTIARSAHDEIELLAHRAAGQKGQ